MVDAAAKVTNPEIVLLPEVFTIAPLPPTPVPDTVMESAKLIPPESDNVAPSAIVVPPAEVPRALLLLIETVPVLIVVVPL